MPFSNLCNRRNPRALAERSDSGILALDGRVSSLRAPRNHLANTPRSRGLSRGDAGPRCRHPAPGDGAHDAAPPASARRATRLVCTRSAWLHPLRRYRPQPDSLVRASDTRCRTPRPIRRSRAEHQNRFAMTCVTTSWSRCSGCLPLKRPARVDAKGAAAAAAALAGRREQPVTRCCSRFEKRKLDSLPHRFGRWFERRASLSNFCNQFLSTSTTTNRSNLRRVSPVEDARSAASRTVRSPTTSEVRGRA